MKSRCGHDTFREFCRECKTLGIGGSGICNHNRQRQQCKECKAQGIGGSQICEHDRHHSKCKICGGSEICEHEIRRDNCSICRPQGVYKRYVAAAKDRDRSFLITLDQFVSIVSLSCIFCDEHIEPRGVDRWDNRVGYLLENCRPCCKTCNKVKGTMDGPTFIDHIRRMADHTRAVENTDDQNNLRILCESIA